MTANEPIDTIPGDPEATAWRRTARARQAAWRERHGWPVGLHVGGATPRPVASRVDDEFATWTACNFLSDDVRAAVAHRVMNPESHQTMDTKRLRGDLLSSMPMCFNLFGALWKDPDLAELAVRRWFPDLAVPGGTVSVRFEWSPGRRDPRWLGDRTAFDAALVIESGSRRHLVGIETKYHEYPNPDPRVLKDKPTPPIPQRYVEVAEGMFNTPGWRAAVWGQRAGQIWRDHLLALACRQDFDEVRYVLVAPEENTIWARLAAEYSDLMSDETAPSFTYRSIESLLEAVPEHPDGARFRQRYLT